MVSTRALLLCSAGLCVVFAGGCSDRTTLAPSALASRTAGASAAQNSGPEYEDVSNQGGPAAGIYAPGGASLLRQTNGLQASVSMPTPEPDSYRYPAGKVAGHPEVFTAWMFVFNNPELCTEPCDFDDLGVDKPAKGGVYNLGGHPASGNSLTISGRVAVGEPPAPHPVVTFAPLESPDTAEVHLAVAPHGALDPASLPDEFRLPAGSLDFWWVAMFK